MYVTFSRGMEARLASGIHRNNMPETQSMDKQFTYKQDYEKKPEVKRRRLTQSGEKIVEHREAKLKSKERDVYRKGQLDPVPAFLRHSTSCKRKLPPAP